jgi:hypothetical protein
MSRFSTNWGAARLLAGSCCDVRFAVSGRPAGRARRWPDYRLAPTVDVSMISSGSMPCG